jgi:hypothetical protein
MQKSDQSKPTCGAVVKHIFKKRVCAEPAVDVMTLLDVDDQTVVKAVLLTCEKHSKDLESGKKLIFIAEEKDGKPVERIAVRFGVKQK